MEAMKILLNSRRTNSMDITMNGMRQNTLPENNDRRWTGFFQNRAAFDPGMMRRVDHAERTAIWQKFNEISTNLDRFIKDQERGRRRGEQVTGYDHQQIVRRRNGEQVYLEDHSEFSTQVWKLFC